MGKRSNTETHLFFCLKCGKNMPLARRISNQKERFHRKKLFCPYCGVMINMIECKNDEDKREFFENFNAGNYLEEAELSIKECNLNGRS